MMRKAISILMGAALAASLAIPALAADSATLTGAGGTAIYPVLSKWAAAYKESKSVEVNYQAIGSGGGIAQIKAKTVAFANSDKPLKPEDLKANKLAQFPGVIIGIVPVINLKGVAPGALVLDGKTLADIFMGTIAKWNDPAIKALNPDVELPDAQIITVHRSDGSGTTFNFAYYLAKVSKAWRDKIGADTSLPWPTGVGGKGNAGVAAYVQQVAGSIGYVEYAYAIENKMTYTSLVNADGKTVEPSLAAFQAASSNADFSKTQDFYLVLANQSGEKSWPITAFTYMLMRRDASKEDNQAVLQFMSWFLNDDGAQAAAKQLEYVPLPAETVSLIKEYWKSELGITL
jgi:phosphate transport system substrate-binding protein